MIYQAMRIPSRSGGGALPTYRRQGEIHAPGAGVTARVDDSAARIAGAGADEEARAQAGLGKAVKGAVDVGIAAYDDYSKSKATQLITEYRRAMDEALYGDGGIFSQKGEAGINADEQRADRARRLRGDLLKDTNEFTRQYFGILADEYDADTSLKARQYGGEQRIVMLNRNDEAASQERADFAMSHFESRADFDRGLGEGLWHAEQILRRQGYSGEALQRGLKEFSSKVFAGAIQQALARNDLRSAERLLAEGGKVHGEGDAAWSRMTGADAAEAGVRIQTRRKALQAEARRRRLELRVGMAGRVEDCLAAWSDGLEAENAPTREDIAEAYGKDAPEVWERLEETRRLGADIRNLRGMSATEQDALLAERKPEAGEGYAQRSKAFQSLARAVERDRRARADDPAGYLASVEPEVNAARRAMYQSMTPDSVNAYAVALQAAREARGMSGAEETAFLPNADARQMAAGLEDSPQPAEALRQLASSAGKHWPLMLRQLSAGGELSGVMRLAANNMPPQAGKKLLEASRDKDFAKKAEGVLGLAGTSKTEFQDLVRSATADFNKTLLAGGDEGMAWEIDQAVERLGLRYMLDGRDAESAVGKAADDVVLGRYSLAGPTKKPFRVPAAFDADRVGDGAEAALRSAAVPGKLAAPDVAAFDDEFTETTYADWVRREGYWVTDADESGVVLFVGGQAVRDENGDVIRRTWDELERQGERKDVPVTGLSREYPW